MFSWQELDLNQPINWAHPLNRGRVAWWLALPQGYGAPTWWDLVQGYLGTFNTFASPYGWNTRANPGGAGSVRFNGSSNKITTSYAGVTGTAARSVAFWFNTTSASGQAVVVSWGTVATGAFWQVDVTAGSVFVRCQGSNVSFGSGYNDGNWHRAVVTFPAGGTQSSVLGYVDGKSLSGTYTGGTTVLNTGTTDAVTIGYSPNSASYWSGYLNDLALWNRVLSLSDIQADRWDSQEGYPGELNWPNGDTLLLSASTTPAGVLVPRPFVYRPRFEPAYFE